MKGNDPKQDNPSDDLDMALPEGITMVDLTPEMVTHKNTRTILYAGMVDALESAHKQGRGIAVDAEKYWHGWTDRSIYLALRRLGRRHGFRIGSDRSKRESDGVIYLWIQDRVKANNNGAHRVRRGPGRPRKDE